MPPKEPKEKIVVGTDDSERLEATKQAQAFARAKRRLDKKLESLQAKRKAFGTSPYFLPRKTGKNLGEKIRLSKGHIISLLALALFADIAQIVIFTADLIGYITKITDFLASLARFIPIVGWVIYAGYQAVKLSAVLFVILVKVLFSIFILIVTRLVMLAIWMHARVNFLYRLGIYPHPKVQSANIFLLPVRFFLAFVEFVIPVAPSFLVLTIIQVWRVKVIQKLQEKKAKN